MDTKIILDIKKYDNDIANLIGSIKYTGINNCIIRKIADSSVIDYNINYNHNNNTIYYLIKKHLISMFNNSLDVNVFFIALNRLLNTYIQHYDYDNDFAGIDNDSAYYACYIIGKMYQ